MSSNDLLSSLSAEDLKKLLLSPEVAKIRKTDPTIKAAEEKIREDIRKEEEAKDIEELTRIANLFSPVKALPKGLKKIKTTQKGISVDIHANFELNSYSAVLKVSVTKGKMTDEQYTLEQDDVRKNIFEAVELIP
jgi:hypothetical protein